MNVLIILFGSALGASYAERAFSVVYSASFREALDHIRFTKPALTRSETSELHQLYIFGTVGQNKVEAQARFVERVHALCPEWKSVRSGKLTRTNKLMLYANLQQASLGSCKEFGGPRPDDLVERAKWNAWNDLGEKNREQAKADYVRMVNKINVAL